MLVSTAEVLCNFADSVNITLMRALEPLCIADCLCPPVTFLFVDTHGKSLSLVYLIYYYALTSLPNILYIIMWLL